MIVAAVITEYNPFHRGHAYQLKTLRAQTGADYLITVMSGDFVQRGEPAVFDKYLRTQMALEEGADLVLQMPVCFSTSSAEDFAACGVSLLSRMGAVDYLGFGSESGDCQTLSYLAGILSEEPETYSQKLKGYLCQGLAYPAARSLALEQYLKEETCKEGAFKEKAFKKKAFKEEAFKKEIIKKEALDGKKILSGPNDILAIEYLKALKRQKSPLKPIAIRREGQDYHGTEIPDNNVFASASAIRKAIRENGLPSIRKQFPPAAAKLLDTCLPTPVFPDDLTALLNYRLLELSKTGLLASFADMSPELAARLTRNLLQFATFSERAMQLKSRSYTYTRICRALLHVLLNITSEQTARGKAMGYAPYIRVLGFRRDAALLLNRIKKSSILPLITKTANARKILGEDGLAMLETDFFASHLYQSLVYAKSHRLMANEYTRSVILCNRPDSG